LGALFQHLPDQQTEDDTDEEEEVKEQCDHEHDDNLEICNFSEDLPQIKEYKHSRICKLRELPDYYNGYPFIPYGYRIDFGYVGAIKSVLSWHNETVNMWTEIIPCILNTFCLSFLVFNDELWPALLIEDKCCFLIGGIII